MPSNDRAKRRHQPAAPAAAAPITAASSATPAPAAPDTSPTAEPSDGTALPSSVTPDHDDYLALLCEVRDLAMRVSDRARATGDPNLVCISPLLWAAHLACWNDRLGDLEPAGMAACEFIRRHASAWDRPESAALFWAELGRFEMATPWFPGFDLDNVVRGLLRLAELGEERRWSIEETARRLAFYMQQVVIRALRGGALDELSDRIAARLNDVSRRTVRVTVREVLREGGMPDGDIQRTQEARQAGRARGRARARRRADPRVRPELLARGRGVAPGRAAAVSQHVLHDRAVQRSEAGDRRVVRARDRSRSSAAGRARADGSRRPRVQRRFRVVRGGDDPRGPPRGGCAGGVRGASGGDDAAGADRRVGATARDADAQVATTDAACRNFDPRTRPVPGAHITIGGEEIAMLEPQLPVPIESLWTVAQVAAYLSVSRSWVYQHAADGTLPCRRLGALLRFVPEEIRAFAASAASDEVRAPRR